MVMARFNLSFIFIWVSLTVLWGLLVFLICGHPLAVNRPATLSAENRDATTRLSNRKTSREINCLINGEYGISCRKEGSEVYVPFSFLERYFEVYGKLSTVQGKERFEWSHSYSKVYRPKTVYKSSGVFMYFNNYNVEVRDRVKCVSASEGVPVSTQWESSGYYYPTQIAQYGLAHYSRNLTEPEPRRKVYEDAENFTAKWLVTESSNIKRVKEETLNNYILTFSSKESSPITLKLRSTTMDLIFSVDLKFLDNGSLTLDLEDKDRSSVYRICYICSSTLISVEDNVIYYGLGPCNRWKKLTRDLSIDLQKGHVLAGRGKKVTKGKIRLTGLTLQGEGALDNLTISSSAHGAMFYTAADYLVANQDEKGGWPISVRRRIGSADLAPGWYSSMSQGQSMSLLMRAYHQSGKEAYLNAALKATKPFFVTSPTGGVRAMFLNQYVWYEEYPTTPPSFVLNGFIYSLIGLYDVLSLAPPQLVEDAKALYDEGMLSLKKLLPLFDTGSGSVYDLRHFTQGLPPNIARWDYHSTHVNQLLLLGTFDSDPIISSTAQRWAGYMQGKRAPHN